MSKHKIGTKGPLSTNLDKAKDVKGTLKRLIKYLEGNKARLIFVLICVILSVIFNICTSLLLQPIIDDYLIPMIQNPEDAAYKLGFIKILIILIGTAVLSGLFTYIQFRIVIKVAQNSVKDIRKDLFDKIERLPIKYFDEHPYGELMSRIVNDIDNISSALNTSVVQIISGTLTLLITLTVMIIISPTLALINLLALPLMLFTVKKISQVTKKQFIRQQEALADVNGYIEEYISGQKIIKAFNKEDDIKSNFSQKNIKLQNEGYFAQAISGVVMPVMGNISNVATVITAVVSGIFAINGIISVGTIALYTRFSKEYSRPITEIANQFNLIQAAIAGAERCFEIIDEQVEFPDNEGAPCLRKVKGKIELNNVYFSYNKNEPVLKNINITANPGETIAIVGPTGAGKTTIINLLTRFYDIDSGQILLDGQDIRKVSKESLRDTLGIVLQDTVMFNESVRDNIRFGKLEATDDEIIQAAKLANAHSFIKRLPHGYDTILSDDSGNISKGQAQLINIARVILNDPQILILDEATSNIDTRMELRINEAMNNLLKGRTSFVIAHRLSTIVNADKILVINNGEIIEQGTHEQLIEKQGFYYNLYTATSKSN